MKTGKKRRRLQVIRVTMPTYKHLCNMAFVSGLRWPGEVVDKLVQNLCIEMQERERYEREGR